MTSLYQSPATQVATTRLNKLVVDLHTTSDLFSISELLADGLTIETSSDIDVFTSLIEVLHERHKAHLASAVVVTSTLEQASEA